MKKTRQKRPFLLRKENRYLWYILVLPAFLTVFFLEEKLVTGSYWVSYMPLDDVIPFCEYFIIPYVLWYPFLFAVGLYMLLRDHEGFKKFMTSIALSFFSVSLFFLIFPNGQDLRPASFERSNICTWIIGIIYTVDDNLNVLPSMHVLGALAAAEAVCMCKGLRSRKIRAAAIVLAVIISVSTTFVKQHSALDVITAIPVAAVIFLIVYRPWRKKSQNMS